MKTKLKNTTLSAIALLATVLFSCTKVETPVISILEVGLDNSKIGIIGSDLHIEANIVAEGKIATVKVEIYPGESGTWEFDSTYTEFSGKKNCEFHKHIDIPVDADAGEYQLSIEVTDMEGNITTATSDLQIQEPSDTEYPVITILSAPTSGQTFPDGETITVTGTVTDNTALGGIYIALVRADQDLSDSEINSTNTIAILHNHGFDTPTEYGFSATITVGAAQDNDMTPKDIIGDIAWQSADYYILVKSKDAFGGNWSFSDHYPIVISL